MINPRGFHQIQKEPSEKFAKCFFQETEDGAQVQSAKITPKTWSATWAAFMIGRLFLKLQLLTAKAEDSEYTTCCFLHCLQVRVLESDVLVVLGGRAHRLSKPRRGMEVFLSVGHAGHAAPQLPQCGKANDFEVCSMKRNTVHKMHLSRKRGLEKKHQISREGTWSKYPWSFHHLSSREPIQYIYIYIHLGSL